MELSKLTIREIALLIQQDWKKPYFGAVPYMDALLSMNSIKDNYFEDAGSSIVAYFLSNATTWRGDVAREVKKELNLRLKTI